MKRRFVQIKGQLIEVSPDYSPPCREAPLVFGDLPSYRSPVNGQWIDGRVARREDLKRTGSRPWEGLEQEKKEAARHQQYAEQRFDASLTKSANEAFNQLPPSKREILRRMK
jgi:hypothetical protein